MKRIIAALTAALTVGCAWSSASESSAVDPANSGPRPSGSNLGASALDSGASFDAAAESRPKDEGSPPATFTQVYAVIAARCSCHVEGSSGDLAMPARSTAYQNLVGRPAETYDCEGGTRVIPGNAQESVLYRKVSGANTCGPPMPLGRPPLSRSEIALFGSWIRAGAADN